MPTTNVNTFDTIEEWRLKTNELGVKIADLDNNLFTINVIASGNITASGNINALGNVVVTNDARVTGNIFGSSNLVITGNVLAANILGNVHYGTWVTSKPAINVLFNGNILGSSNLLISNSGTNIITISANVANDSVTLGTHTVGNYVKEITSADTSNIIVNNGVGEGTTPTVNLAMTAVTPGVYANANTVASFTVSRDGRLTAASNVLIDRAYILTSGKPSVNLRFTGDVAGTANLNLSNENTNFLSVGLTIQPDSVALGTDTTGDYVQSVSSADSGNIVVTSGSGEGSTPTLNLGMTTVSPNTYGGENVISTFTVTKDGRLTAASNVTPNYLGLTAKPAVNLTFTGDVTGTGSMVLSGSSTNNLSIGLTVAADSVALGTDTTGNYVQSLTQGAGITLTGATPAEGGTPTISANVRSVGTFVGDVSNANLLSSLLQVDGAGSGLDADVLDGQNGTYYLDWANQSNKPAINLTFTGDVTGTGGVVLTNSGTNSLSIGLTIGADSVALGSDTTGNYVQSITSADNANIIVSSGTGEGSTPTVNLAMTAVNPGTYGNANSVSSFTVTRDGRLVSASNVAIDRRYITVTEKPSINLRFVGDATGSGNLTISNSDKNELAITMSVSGVSANTLPTTPVTPGTYGGTNRVPYFTVDNTGRLTDAGNAQLVYSSVANKPSVNLTFTGDVTGSGSINLANENTNSLSIGLTIAADSIALGTDTTGNYTDRVVGGTGLTATGTANEGNVITVGLTNTGVAAATYGNARIIPSFTVDAQGRITSASNITMGSDVANILLTGDVTGSANAVLGPNSTIISIATTIAPNSVALGTDTTGNYTNRVEPGTMITVSGTGDEGNVITVNHADTSTLNGVQGGAGIASITVDDRGHVTAVTTATYCTSVPASSNVFSYFGAGGNTISQTNSTHSAINSTEFNFFAGRCAGQAITTGVYNIIFGSCTGQAITSGRHNFIAGQQAGRYNTSGCSNNFFGQRAGYCNTTGSNNTFIGDNAGYFSTFGCNNIGIGSTSLNQITTGSQNISLGDSSGWLITSGNRNINLGQFAGGNVRTGNDNIIVGCLTSCVGLTTNTSNVIIMATGGIQRFIIDPVNTGVLIGGASGAFRPVGFVGGDNSIVGALAGCCITSASSTTLLGAQTGRYLTSGLYNTFAGAQSGRGSGAALTGSRNSFFGYQAGRGLSSGSDNSFFGHQAGCSTFSGSCNLFAGQCAGFNNSTGSRNIYLGQCSGGNVTTGNDNIIVGCLSSCVGLTQSTSNVIIMATGGCQKVKIDSRNNFFVGQLAGICAATSCHNVGVGSYTMSSPTYGIVSGCYNTAFGRFTLRNLTSGNHNVAIGNQSLLNLQNGNDNVAIGPSTLTNNFSAWRNIAIGSNAIGSGCITGYDNIAMGCSAGQCLTSAECNNFIGRGAGYYTTTGSNNNFFGSQAGFKNEGGTFNTFIGYQAGYYNTGNYNYFLGIQAGFFNTSGINNNFFGSSAGNCNTTGSYNNFMGRWAGFRNSTGCNNVFLGHLAGCCNTTGSNNLFFGCMSGVTLGCTSTESNRIVMGNPSHTLACIQIAWTTPSDIRDKCIFGPVPHGKSFLGKINPITFSFKNRETNELKETKKRYGFSAQEVLEAEGSDPVIVGTDNPEKLGFTTDFIIPILVNAVKELTKDVEDLRAEIAELKKSR